MKLTMTRSSVGFLSALTDAHMIFNSRRKCGHHRASLKIRNCTGDHEETVRQTGREVGNKRVADMEDAR